VNLELSLMSLDEEVEDEIEELKEFGIREKRIRE
jgi:hypothetical protein